MKSIIAPRSADPTITRSHGLWDDMRMVTLSTVVFFAVVAPNLAYRGGAIVCVVVVLISLASGYRMRIADKYGLAYAALTGASILWSQAPQSSWTAFLNATACTVVFLAVRATVNRDRDYWFMGGALIMGSVVSVGLMVASGAELRWTYEPLATRIGVEGLNINYTAYALVVTAVVILSLLHATRGRRNRARKVLLIGLLLAMYLGVVMTGTRGALYGLVILVIWWFVSRASYRFAYRGLVFVAIAAQIAMITGVLDQILGNSVSPSTRDSGDLSGRLIVWPVARAVFWDAPIFGHGAGTFRANFGDGYEVAAHAAVLDVGTGLGAMGIFLFFGCFWFAISRGNIEGYTSYNYLVSGSFIAATVAIMLSGVVNESLPLWIVLALISRFVIVFPNVCTSQPKRYSGISTQGRWRNTRLR